MTRYPMIPAASAPALTFRPSVSRPGSYVLRRADGVALPDNMYAVIRPATASPGKYWYTIQARSKHARRSEQYGGTLEQTQETVMRWARRVIRERLAETPAPGTCDHCGHYAGPRRETCGACGAILPATGKDR